MATNEEDDTSKQENGNTEYKSIEQRQPKVSGAEQPS
jgi:hypothetical protein